MKILDKQVSGIGVLRKVKLWGTGAHCGGMIVHGWTGLETTIEKDCIHPTHVFTVEPEDYAASHTKLAGSPL